MKNINHLIWETLREYNQKETLTAKIKEKNEQVIIEKHNSLTILCRLNNFMTNKFAEVTSHYEEIPQVDF